jgi:hypothetical protein
MTIERMRITCWMPKAKNTHWQYVILIVFPLQQWLYGRASVLTLYALCMPCPAWKYHCSLYIHTTNRWVQSYEYCCFDIAFHLLICICIQCVKYWSTSAQYSLENLTRDQYRWGVTAERKTISYCNLGNSVEFLIYKTNVCIYMSNIHNNTVSCLLLLHVSAELRHIHGVYKPIFKTHKGIIHYTSYTYYIIVMFAAEFKI